MGVEWGRVGRSPALCLKAQVLSSLLEAGGREAQEWDCITQSRWPKSHPWSSPGLLSL